MTLKEQRFIIKINSQTSISSLFYLIQYINKIVPFVMPTSLQGILPYPWVRCNLDELTSSNPNSSLTNCFWQCFVVHELGYWNWFGVGSNSANPTQCISFLNLFDFFSFPTQVYCDCEYTILSLVWVMFFNELVWINRDG